MNISIGRPLLAGVLILPLLACGASHPDAERSSARWEHNGDGFIHVDADSSFRQITRCWTFGEGLSDCVWVGGSGTSSSAENSFSAERWFTSGIPEQAGPQRNKRRDEAYYGCLLKMEDGRLSSVHEYLTRGDGTALLSNDRWLNTPKPRAAWALDDLLAWSERTGNKMASPLTDCELIGRIIEAGGWTALRSDHWTAPLVTAADGLATLSP